MTETCGECGHHISWHGRRGYGACRHGRQTSGLAGAVDAVRVAVVARLDREQRQALIDAAMKRSECNCRRFRVAPVSATERKG
jgi:hypothetical protein